MLLFYAPDIMGSTYVLSEIESRHVLKVLRKSVGDIIYLTDGKGNMYTTRITGTDVKACMVEVVGVERDYRPLPYQLHMAVAPTKNQDRMEWFAEKAVEIGVSRISTIICDNSERISVKADRLQRVMVSAMKQSLCARLPLLDVNVPFNALLEEYKEQSALKLIAYCGASPVEKLPLKQIVQAKQNVLVLIGPEGDFSEREFQQALSQSFVPVTLGDMRLRTETAALYVCAAVNLLNQ
ncbi:MAG: 16S rRNA (uracil(1498)-N(3))-methyltransferase [Bacteroidales bacterium]|nr:16S rRNA (uracil(1498)-N(3))-methyltransferase [Bacteroidales bacterium]